MDVFTWSNQDMPNLDTNIVVHHLPLREECPPVKQKLRRTRPDMAIKIKEEVKKTNQIIMEIHEGSCRTHASGHTMVKKILRAGYYWMTMEVDCHRHIQTCHKCQIYTDKIHVLPTPLSVLTSPWPFSMWGIDMIGRIEPTASNGHFFILVAINYFIKWV
jgi:hypothetical protein